MQNSVNRRLKSTEGIDLTAPRNWTGELSAQNVDLPDAWKCGRVKAKAILPDCEWFSAAPVQEGVSVLKPNDDEMEIHEDMGEVGVDVELFEDMISTAGASVNRYVTLDDGQTTCHYTGC